MGTPELSDSLLWSAQGTVGQSQLTSLLAIYHRGNRDEESEGMLRL